MKATEDHTVERVARFFFSELAFRLTFFTLRDRCEDVWNTSRVSLGKQPAKRWSYA
jgi:hypothetical protein